LKKSLRAEKFGLKSSEHLFLLLQQRLIVVSLFYYWYVQAVKWKWLIRKGALFYLAMLARDDDEVIQTLQLVWQQISLRGYNIVRRSYFSSRVIFFYIATSYLKWALAWGRNCFPIYMCEFDTRTKEPAAASAAKKGPLYWKVQRFWQGQMTPQRRKSRRKFASDPPQSPFRLITPL